MRLFRVDDNDKYHEITSTQRFSNVDDAVIIAQSEGGDGAYALDLQNGNVRLFHIIDGEFKYDPEVGAQVVAADQWPSKVYDREHVDAFSENVSEGGVYYPPDDEGVGPRDPNHTGSQRQDFFGQMPEDATNSYEEYTGTSNETPQVPDSAPLTETRATDEADPQAEATTTEQATTPEPTLQVEETPVAEETTATEETSEQENEYVVVPGVAEGE
ncbi:MAG: hypothetical protein NWE76_01400 [Candidatus Bathyarchaeota archaeon]|nr:hypothetical protein [Candidatus Bathyarchaeota archaeon]